MKIESAPHLELQVRRYFQGEEVALQNIYFESSRQLNSQDYTHDQIERWVEKHSDLAEWTARLERMNPFVVVRGEKPIAFGELELDGHIDFFYCHPDWQGRGAGGRLLDTIVEEALLLGLDLLYAEVSVTAEPFFTKKGFEILEERNPIICGAPAKQFIMQRKISDIPVPSNSS